MARLRQLPNLRAETKPAKTRSEWAAAICEASERAIGAFIKVGRTLIDAKQALPHGDFMAMIETDLPFGPSTAERLMKIAADKRISAHGPNLPTRWRTVYELTKLDDETFEQGIASGEINPQMQRQAAKRIKVTVTDPVPAYSLPKVVQQGETVIIRPRQPMDDAAPEITDGNASDEPEPIASLALARLGKAGDAFVAAIEAAIEQGERPDLIEAAVEAVCRRAERYLDQK